MFPHGSPLRTVVPEENQIHLIFYTYTVFKGNTTLIFVQAIAN